MSTTERCWSVLIWCMAERVQVRELTNDEGRRLLSIVRTRFGFGSAVAARPDRVVVGAADGRARYRQDRVHVRGSGAGRDP